MKKSDLKTGMIVLTKDGHYRIMFYGTAISLTFNGLGGGLSFEMIKENLIGNKYSDFDIIKVYQPNPNKNYNADFNHWIDNNCENLLKYCTLIWEYKEEIQKTFNVDGIEYSETTLINLIRKATNK